MINYQPKGGMCLQCKYKFENCSYLPFHLMKVVLIYPDNVHVVKCTNYAH